MIKWTETYNPATLLDPNEYEAEVGIFRLDVWETNEEWCWTITIATPDRGDGVVRSAPIKSGDHASPYGAKAAARGAVSRLIAAAARAL